MQNTTRQIKNTVVKATVFFVLNFSNAERCGY